MAHSLAHYPLVLAILLGLLSGLRSLTPSAVVTWAARWTWLPLAGTRLALMGSTGVVAIFTLAALIELGADKLPSTPNRTAPAGLTARIVFGALSAAAVTGATSGPTLLGALLGAIWGLVGAFGGYYLRTGLVRALGCPTMWSRWPRTSSQSAAAFSSRTSLDRRPVRLSSSVELLSIRLGRPDPTC